MHKIIITCNVLSIVLGVSVSYTCLYESADPRIQIYEPKDCPEIQDVDLCAFLVTDSQDDAIIQNGSFTKQSNGWWYYENFRILLMPGQEIRFEIYVKRKKYNELALIKKYRKYIVPLWPGNRVTDNKTCEKSETTIKGRKACAGELIFEDNFDLLSKPIWTGEYRIPLDINDADFAMYNSTPFHIYTQRGNLHVRPMVTDEVPYFDESEVRTGQVNLGKYCTGIVHRERECRRQAKLFRILSPIVSAQINTKKSFLFQYGKIEVRAKLPKGDWLFPLITLEPRCSDYGVFGYSSGQMRIAFIRGNEQLQTKNGKAIDGSYLFGGVVLNTGESNREIWLRKVRGPKHWGNDFHNYALTWTNNSISLAYDGKTYATLSGAFDPSMVSRMAPFDKEFYISIGVSAGGISDFPDGSVSGMNEKPWNNTDPKGELKFYKARRKWLDTWKEENHHLLIDHVKVWAL